MTHDREVSPSGTTAGERDPSPTGTTAERRRLDRRVVARSEGTSCAGLAVPEDGPRPACAVVVVDDHAVLADAIVRALRREGFAAAAVDPSTPDGIMEAIAGLGPTLALVDLDLGLSEMSGFDLIGPLREQGVDVVVLSASDDQLLKAASIEEGARGLLSKAVAFEELLEGVKLAARGELVPDPLVADELRRLLREHRREHASQLAPFERLSPRERVVLALLVDGMSAETIAEASYVSIATVRSQIRGVLTKLGVSSQLSAVAVVKRCGWSGDERTPMVRYSSTLSL
ncbi:MAG TPA: response regulator transcription factor [Acidimicrobiales bacterium]|nr:response regulator transcription factor [Acidimicrobiales bacterium]